MVKVINILRALSTSHIYVALPASIAENLESETNSILTSSFDTSITGDELDSAVQIPNFRRFQEVLLTFMIHRSNSIRIATTPAQHVNRCFPCCSVARTNSYQRSYFPNTIANWNSLPSEVTECASVQTFKKHVISFL